MLTFISKYSDILNIKKNGQSVHFGYVKLFYLPINDNVDSNVDSNVPSTNVTRLCMIIRKAFGNAVKRNLLRRRIKHIIHLFKRENPKLYHCDIVIQVDRQMSYTYDYIYYTLLASMSKIKR